MVNTSVNLLQQRVARNPYDNEAWDMLVDELSALRDAPGVMEKLVETLENIVELFPSAGKHWKMLADIKLDQNDINAAINLFSKCLTKCFNVGLWESYMRFIKMSNASKGDTGHHEVMQAYDYVLDRLGQDSGSGVLWLEFVKFMSSFPPSSSTFRLLFQPEAGKEASKRALRLRDIFQRALLVPSGQLEQIWTEYERFESSASGRNSLAGTRFIEDARPRYYTAREAWSTRRKLLAAIDQDALPWMPGQSPESVRLAEQRAAWQALLDHERSNMQCMDATLLQKRVNLVYQQALQPLRGCPEVWYAWAVAWNTEDESANTAHVTSVLTQACAALPECVMLAFALADALETSKQHAAALKIYENLAKRMEAGKEGGLSAEAGSVVWIQYMQFQQRSAANMQDAQSKTRRVFMQARKWKLCSWQVYAFHALLEWVQNRTLLPQNLEQSVTIVKNIFDLGLRLPHVQSQPEYIKTFASWLVSSTGDVDNARLLFQNALADEAVQKRPEMWKYFQEFEARHGTINELLAVEAQWRASLPEARSGAHAFEALHRMRLRYSCFDLWPCTLAQREHLEKTQGLPSGVAAVESRAQTSDLPASVALFISKLPVHLEAEQPVPDVDYVIDLLMQSNLQLGVDNGRKGGEKRRRHSSKHTAAPSNAPNVDIFQMRQRLK